MNPIRTLLAASAIGLAALAPVAAEAADKGPGIDALREFRKGAPNKGVVQNRFFAKKERFELAPVLGLVPNNPFARRFVGGVLFGYHFNEQLSAQAVISYSPDLGEADLKGLTKTLVRIAQTSTQGANFQQPLDKITLATTLVACWAPFYGKINLIGETVLNFDLYGVAGLGLVAKANYFARYDADAPPGEVPVRIDPEGNEAQVGPVLGAGFNFFLNQTVALKIDLRSMLYVDKKPEYDATVPVDDSRLYNHMTATVGVSFFFPKMKPRMLNF